MLLHPSKHWRLAAFSFYKGKSYWRAGDLDQGINLEWPFDEFSFAHACSLSFVFTLYQSLRFSNASTSLR